jgi:hypothetical protein
MSMKIVYMIIFSCILFPAYSQNQGRKDIRGDIIQDRPVYKIASQPQKDQFDEYNAQVLKTIFELQKFRENSSIAIENNAGQRGKATLTNINPLINTWFLLTIDWNNDHAAETYHLENPDPTNRKVTLDSHYPRGITIVEGKQKSACDLWSSISKSDLSEGRDSNKPYAPLCGTRLYLRNKTKGHKTTMEWATDFLRNYIAGGEKITVFIREQFFQDAFLSTSKVFSTGTSGVDTARPRPPGAPVRPLINPQYSEHYLILKELGIDLDYEMENKVLVGRWYRVKNIPGIFVSAIQPKLVAEEVNQNQKKQVNLLDEIESSAMVYMVAFDLDQFELGFAMGTEHPRVDWSDRIQKSVRDNSLPGPDGIGTVEPLVNTGMVNPLKAKRVVATFVGGFKRYHGAFRYSDFAFKNHGSHYGFIENGATFSKLQPGLVTAIIYNDGAVELKTWTDEDDADLGRIRHARQNGVPIIDYDETSGVSKPGSRVMSWGPGNWSGSTDGRYRTLRSGIGLQEHDGYRFLIYGYFSTATPSAMAQVFQAYQCKYAMLLDMNALEHTYLAVYQEKDSKFSVQHLIRGMDVLDKSFRGQAVPRFIGYADNRDFFYLLKRTK